MTHSADESALTLPPTSRLRPGDFGRWVTAGTIVAVLDLSFAATWWVVYRRALTLPQLLQSIASSLLGPAAFHDGTLAAWLGLGVHIGVAFGWSAAFVLLVRHSSRVAATLASPGGAFKVGMPYGMMVCLAMDFVLVPLTRHGSGSAGAAWFWGSLVWQAIGVGLPMALVMRGSAA